MSYLIAAIDESMRPGQYLLCATVVSTADLANVRQSLRALLLPNQRRLHAYRERDGRNRMLLKAMREIPGVSCHVAVGKLRRAGGRDQCLRCLITHLTGVGVRQLVLDRVDHGTAKLDRQTMAGFTVAWRHEASHHEPLLWVSDLVAFACTSGGDWRRAAEPLIAASLTVPEP